MKMTLTQKYMIHSITKKGVLHHIHLNYISTAFLMDLIVNDFIVLNNKQINIKKDLSTQFEYLSSIYDLIKKNDGITYKKLKRVLCFAKKGKELVDICFCSVINVMIENNMISKQTEGKYLPNDELKLQVVEEINGLINKQNLNTEQMFLFILLKNNFDLVESFEKQQRLIFKSQANHYVSLYKLLIFNPHSTINLSLMVVTLSAFFVNTNIIEFPIIINYILLGLLGITAIFVIITICLFFRNTFKKVAKDS